MKDKFFMTVENTKPMKEIVKKIREILNNCTDSIQTREEGLLNVILKEDFNYTAEEVSRLVMEECKKAHELGWKEGADNMYGSGRDRV